MQNFNAKLNEQQLKAVTSKHQNTLVIAGAGSGKTRVLVHRCAWLIQEEQVHTNAILAVTFTNKAAQEMQSRIESLLEQPLYGMWCGTFHGLCHRLLKQNASLANLSENFQIIDQDDQQKLIKKIQKELNLDETRWPAKKTQAIINSLKEQGKRAKDFNQKITNYQKNIQTVYTQYEKICLQQGFVDFTEILLKTVELLDNNEEIKTYYNDLFSHILIDEFQDTNQLQYRWINLISGKNTKITAVGDDDQSIYSWRGAKIDHLIRFTKEFHDVVTIRLEQNYRSTNTILSAANSIIKNNNNRLGKTLWTEQQSGDNIDLYQAYNEIDEVQYICQQIKIYYQQGINLDEIAILYRSNAQSRILEEQLTRANIPYKIYGGLKFFDRAEIKDTLAYLRLVAREHDDAAFERSINTPARGIGLVTMNKIRELAKLSQISLWDSANIHLEKNILATKTHKALEEFIHLIKNLQQQNLTLNELCKSVIDQSGIKAHLEIDRHKNSSKIDNIEELINATQSFNDNEPNTLSDFLNNIVLEQSNNEEQQSLKVQLMTLHASKGLEFNYIFLIGLEEGLFPHKMCLYDPTQVEEERRLCYVGITRAMHKLHISYAESRRLHGSTTMQQPSRFILEIPKNMLNPIRIKNPTYTNYEKHSNIERPKSDKTIKLGQKVIHKYFGEGTILNCDGQGDAKKVQIVFKNKGVKWLMFNQAPLTLI